MKKLLAILFGLSAVSSAEAAYNQLMWGMNFGVSPYAFGVNLNNVWYNMGTISSSGVWTIPVNNTSLRYVSTLDYGALCNGSANDYTALSNTLVGGATTKITTPPATCAFSTAGLTTGGAHDITIFGANPETSNWEYTGVNPVTAAFLLGDYSNFTYNHHISNMTFSGNANTTYAFGAYRPTSAIFDHIRAKNANPTNGTGFYSYDGVGNTYNTPRVGNDWNAMTTVPYNCMVFDGDTIGSSSTTSTVLTPTAANCPNYGLALKNAQLFFVTAGQIGGNGTNLYMGPNSEFNVYHGLLESAGTYAALIEGSFNTLFRAQLTDHPTVYASGAQGNSEIGSVHNGPIDIQAGAVGTYLDNNAFSGPWSITDAGTNSRWSHLYDASSNDWVTNYPSDQEVSSSGNTSGIGLKGVSRWFGTWVTDTTQVISPSPSGVFGKAWRAYFIGTWIQAGRPVSPTAGNFVELNETESTVVVSLAPGNLTFSVNSSGQFQMTSSAGTLGFSGEIIFVPNQTDATTTTPGLTINSSIQLAGSHVGTFTCNSGTLTVANTNIHPFSMVTISLQTKSGFISTPPAMSDLVADTSFNVTCGAADNSVYNYWIWN